MGANDANGDPALHITAIRTWHRAAMVIIVVRQTDQIHMSAQNAKIDKRSKKEMTQVIHQGTNLHVFYFQWVLMMHMVLQHFT